MKSLNNIIIILFSIVCIGIAGSSCSNEELSAPAAPQATLKKIPVVLKVTSGNDIPTSLAQQSRFGVTIPKDSVGRNKYQFKQGESLYLMTDEYSSFRVSSNIYDTLRCTRVDSTGTAMFGGDVFYDYSSWSYKTLHSYFILGSKHEITYHDNLNLLTKCDEDGSFDSDGVMFQYGKATRTGYPVDPIGMPDSVSLNMITSIATVNVGPEFFSKFKHVKVQFGGYVGYTKVQSGPKYPTFDVREGTVVSSYSSESMGRTLHFNTDTLGENLKQRGLLAFSLLPAKYTKFQITITATSDSVSYYRWKSNVVDFTTVVGKPSSVDNFAKKIYSSNRSFYFGTAKMAALKTEVEGPSDGDGIDIIN